MRNGGSSAFGTSSINILLLAVLYTRRDEFLESKSAERTRNLPLMVRAVTCQPEKGFDYSELTEKSHREKYWG